jgi:hypothetical protein
MLTRRDIAKEDVQVSDIELAQRAQSRPSRAGFFNAP